MNQIDPPALKRGGMRSGAALLWTIAAGTVVKLIELFSVTLWSPRLLRADLRYAWHALRLSSYRAGGFEAALRARQTRTATDSFAFGETPWFTARALLARAQLAPGQRFVDLGSGDGRVALYAAVARAAQAAGYEWLAERHQIAERVAGSVGGARLQLHCGDAASADLAQADVVYCAWTCLDETARRRLLPALLTMPPGSRLVTNTYPVAHPGFEHLGSTFMHFFWGRGEIHFQRRR